jgi:hypothetical protein
MLRPLRALRHLWGLGALALGLLATGCFNQFEEYRQTTPPARPPGAVAVPPGPPSEVFPLMPGSRYEYAARFGLGASGPFQGDAVISVIDAWQLGDRRIDEVRVVSRYFGQTRRDPYRFVRTTDWIGLFEKYPPDQVTFFMPTSLEAGKAWAVETGEGTGRANVEAIEPVKVPAGTFNQTWRVRYINPGANTDMTLWLAPRLGLVKATVAMQANLLPLRGTLELQRVDLPVGTRGVPSPDRSPS